MREQKEMEAMLDATVDDHVPTGTPDVLESPHVTEGPGKIANAPVPSVFRDDRGSIDRLRVGGKRINLLYSVSGVMRSGYLHPETKYGYVVSGEVEVWVLTNQGTDKKVYKSQQTFVIRPYTPHILHFLNDSVVAEWWDQAGDTQCWYYHPYRRIVDIQNSLLSTSTGQHHFLVPQTDYERQQQEKTGASSSGLLWMATGLAIGMILGGYVVRTTSRP
ncbi:hypothetical protein IV203_024137 [Nitzschia inconspicua]|uniref:Uncharacterized protein n=1 Tax=Nitzschia inconspicua TaxID=303405 RepID=A0A9K3P7R5_9STRA|nr:hypothetical protein IV203_024560 [Nitzschia inconspicua]KAG7340594.1 hypothetical protein IV203_024137 [Nitzschia inconspicua]